MSFRERLAAAITASQSMLCLGLDPHGAENADSALDECRRLLDEVGPEICAVKPNVAFFERFGSEGHAALERLRGHVPRQLIYVVDAKRGDIGSTAEAYATALFDVLGADAVTINPLMGHDCVEPFMRPDHGVLLLTRTSNPGAADLLMQPLADGSLLYERIIDLGVGWDGERDLIGFVVGATDPEAVARVRRRAGDAPLLVPGIGAQGGDLEATVGAALDADGAGVMVPLSRGISRAPEGAAAAARAMRQRIEAVRRERMAAAEAH